jgi:hypothetical protein
VEGLPGVWNRMETRRNNFDVTNLVDTTDVDSVNREVGRIFRDLYPQASTRALDQTFADVGRLYQGEYPGYLACDTEYHNLQHTLDVTLAMARLMDGYERSRGRGEAIGSRLFLFGMVAALLHDIGYIRREKDTRHRNGAEYTLKHVARSGRFIEEYMGQIGMSDLAKVASQIVHFTGYERPVQSIKTPGLMFRLLGNMLGTADIIAQMSDRCYLEKCRDRLYPEFVAGGLAMPKVPEPTKDPVFSSPAELVSKTPVFYRTATNRLNDLLGGVYAYAQDHFGDQNLYLDEIDKNVSYAESVAVERDLSLLRRTPPASGTGQDAEDGGEVTPDEDQDVA